MAICQSKVVIILVPSCGTHHTSNYEHRPTYLASCVGKIVPVYYRTVISSSCNRRLSQLVVGAKQAQTSKLNAMSNQQRPSIFVLRNDKQQSTIQSREENETKRAARYIIAILSQDFLIPHASRLHGDSKPNKERIYWPGRTPPGRRETPSFS